MINIKYISNQPQTLCSQNYQNSQGRLNGKTTKFFPNPEELNFNQKKMIIWDSRHNKSQGTLINLWRFNETKSKWQVYTSAANSSSSSSVKSSPLKPGEYRPRFLGGLDARSDEGEGGELWVGLPGGEMARPMRIVFSVNHLFCQTQSGLKIFITLCNASFSTWLTYCGILWYTDQKAEKKNKWWPHKLFTCFGVKTLTLFSNMLIPYIKQQPQAITTYEMFYKYCTCVTSQIKLQCWHWLCWIAKCIIFCMIFYVTFYRFY